ncbi:MAG TPA: OsmC family protein [Thermoanaerobaculia bacterium]|nr:OsmC family protein [Thermoanaerobaculia bacterium]
MMQITFPGGVAVEAAFGGHTIRTDQPRKAGGADSAPSPFDLFLAAIGTCAGYYALRFCQERVLGTEGLGLTLETDLDARGHVTTVRLEIALPPHFPEKYRPAIVRAVEHCKVKAHIEEPPRFEVAAVEGRSAPLVAAAAGAP